jgi:hypothetical protein
MNYTNYEQAIVKCHGMELKGWPFELLPIWNPSHIGEHKSVQLLLNTLIEGTCKWMKLTEEELADRITSNHAREAAGETIYKPWKKHVQKAAEKSAAIIESSDNVTRTSASGVAPIHFPPRSHFLPIPGRLRAHTHAIPILADRTLPLPLLVIFSLIVFPLTCTILARRISGSLPLCPFYPTGTYPIIS